jgi:hypothetical protein
MTLQSFETSSLLTTGDTYKKSITEFHYYAAANQIQSKRSTLDPPFRGAGLLARHYKIDVVMLVMPDP